MKKIILEAALILVAECLLYYIVKLISFGEGGWALFQFNLIFAQIVFFTLIVGTGIARVILAIGKSQSQRKEF